MTSSIDVKALRQRIGWTQDRLASYLGLDRSSISRMESGQKPKGPVLRLLSALVDAADRDDASSVEDRGAVDALCPTEPAE